MGLDETEPKSVVSIYPNPASSTVTISTGVVYSTAISIQVFDNTGRIVLQTEIPANSVGIYDVNINSLAKGIYMLRLINSSKIINQIKLVKE